MTFWLGVALFIEVWLVIGLLNTAFNLDIFRTPGQRLRAILFGPIFAYFTFRGA